VNRFVESCAPPKPRLRREITSFGDSLHVGVKHGLSPHGDELMVLRSIPRKVTGIGNGGLVSVHARGKPREAGEVAPT
jgi:hypothetical protein